MTGKHYLVACNKYPNLKRQYTICNVLQKNHYKEYLRVINEFLNQKNGSTKDIVFSEKYIDEKSS